MHQQIKASPDNTADNARRIINALAAADINIEALAPDFDPPHVRVIVDHDDFDAAMKALSEEGLSPEVKSAVVVTIPNQPRALKGAMEALARRGYTIESVLVLPNSGQQNTVRVSFGIRLSGIAGWDDAQADDLGGEIGNEIN